MGSSFRAISSRIGSTHSAAQLGGGGWGRAGREGWSCQAMVQPGSAESSASMLQLQEDSLAASCLIPVLRALWVCCCMLNEKWRSRAGEEKAPEGIGSTTDVPSLLRGSCLPVWKAERQMQETSVKGEHSCLCLCVKSGKCLCFSHWGQR